MVYFKENYCFLNFREGPSFSNGVNFFKGLGVNMQISIDTYRTYDFQGGPDPIPPLDLRIHSFFYSLKLFS